MLTFISVHFKLLTYASSEEVDPLKGKSHTCFDELHSILSKFPSTSKVLCVLRCKRCKECVKTAMQHTHLEDICDYNDTKAYTI